MTVQGMTQRVPSSGLTVGQTQSTVTYRTASWATSVLVFSILLVMVQGVFYTEITTLVTERSFPLFRILPFNLYPSDLIVLPVLMVSSLLAIAQLAHGRTTQAWNLFWIGICGLALMGVALVAHWIAPMRLFGPFLLTDLALAVGVALFVVVVVTAVRLRIGSTGRLRLLIGWWAIALLGIAVGIATNNPDLLGDIRGYLLRSFIPVAIFYLAILADLRTVFDWVKSVGAFLAVYVALASLMIFAGLPMLPVSGLYGGVALLLPYALVLAQLLVERKASRMKVYMLGIIAIAIVATLSKPLLAGFLICNVLMLLLLRVAVRGVRIPWLKLAGLLLAAVIFVGGILLLSGGLESAVDYVLDKYLKQDRAVQDLSGNRFAIWQQGLQRWQDSPVVGNGFGYLLSAEVIELTSGRTDFREVVGAHNFIVEMLYKVGGAGVALLLVIGTAWIWLVLKTLVNFSSAANLAYYLSVIVIAMTIVGMGMYGSHIAHPIGGTWLWFALGAEAALAAIGRQQVDALQSKRVRNGQSGFGAAARSSH